MTVTCHPVDKKAKTKASPATSSKTSSKKPKTPKKAEKWSDGEELSDDRAPFAGAAAVARGTRKFSPLGFLIMLCQSDFGAVSTATDTRKRSIIGFIEGRYKVLCNGSTSWKRWRETEQQHILGQLNGPWSKTYKSWRLGVQRSVKSLLQKRRNTGEEPVLSYFQV